MDKRWIQDIMSQQFTNGTFVNPTRLIMATCIVSPPVSKRISKAVVLEYIYRTFADHPEIAERNPNVMIRNICNYGLNDIEDSLEEALYDWCADAKNNILTYDNRWIYFDVDAEDETLEKSTMQVVQMLYKKYFKMEVLRPIDITEEDVKNDTDLVGFGSGIFKRRVLEDIQYCPLCEETRQENLYAVHIFPNKYNTSESKVDKENGLIFCLEHAQEYIDGRFYFSESGFIKNTMTETVDKRMHLSFAILTKKRKAYLKKYMQEMENR